MTWQGPEFVIIVIGMSFVGWIVTTWIRARHGYALEDEWGGKTERSDSEVKRLRDANEALTTRLTVLERRTAVLEAIVTDDGWDIARRIDGLGKAAPGHGVAIDNDNREMVR